MLTCVVAGRNDGHGGHMTERFNIYIDSLYQQAQRFQLPIELIIVEWNPPDWSKPLAEVLRFPTGSEWFKTRIITVLPEIHATFDNTDKLDFFQMIAKNVGIRRATHPWILATNPDLVYSDKVFATLPRLKPEANCFYRVFRNDLTCELVPAGQSIEERLAYCQQHVKPNGIQAGVWNDMHTHACGDFTLLHKNYWLEQRGYRELHLWSIHIDSLFLCQLKLVMMGEVVLRGAAAYHLEHARSWVVNPELIKLYPHIDLAEVELYLKMGANGAQLPMNNESWGLADYDLPEVTIT